MRHARWLTAWAVLLAVSCAGGYGQDKAGQPDPAPALPSPPKGFDVKRDGIDHGKL